jgi:hypothetical protein
MASTQPAVLHQEWPILSGTILFEVRFELL